MRRSDIIEQAQKEIEEERLRAAIDKEKDRIYKREGFWKKIFPFTITIKRR